MSQNNQPKTRFFGIKDINKNAGKNYKTDIEADKRLKKEIVYGNIIKNILDIPTTTDILIWENEKSVYPYKLRYYDSQTGVHEVNFDDYPAIDVDYIKTFVEDMPVILGIKISKRFNSEEAILDGYLQYNDNAIIRINVIHGSLTGTTKNAVAIRKTAYALTLTKENMLNSSFLDEKIFNLLTIATNTHCNSIISGITGSGKTSLLRFLAINSTNDKDAIITIEDTLEAYIGLLAPQKMVLSLKSNDKYDFGKLLHTSLRQNPDWIMVSEARDADCVKKLLQAAGTGHYILSTIHSASARNIPHRIVDMSEESGASAERIFLRTHDNVDFGIHIDYSNDESGTHRKIVEICEYYITTDNKPVSHTICIYNAEEDKYDYEYIQSQDIKNKLYKSKNVGLLKGVFLK